MKGNGSKKSFCFGGIYSDALHPLRAGGKTPRISRSGGLTYAQGAHVTYGKNFLGACRCMTVVVL